MSATLPFRHQVASDQCRLDLCADWLVGPPDNSTPENEPGQIRSYLPMKDSARTGNTSLHHSVFSSISWEHCYSLRQYPTLVSPCPPRILDPANPANNLYLTGISSSLGAQERGGEHKVGGGNWRALCNNIGSLDLSKPLQYWIWPHPLSTISHTLYIINNLQTISQNWTSNIHICLFPQQIVFIAQCKHIHWFFSNTNLNNSASHVLGS